MFGAVCCLGSAAFTDVEGSLNASGLITDGCCTGSSNFSSGALFSIIRTESNIDGAEKLSGASKLSAGRAISSSVV